MRSMRRAAALVGILALAACGGDDAAEDAALPPADTAPAVSTRAQRDSAIAGSRLPGAQGVRGAMNAAELARQHAEATDTMLP